MAEEIKRPASLSSNGLRLAQSEYRTWLARVPHGIESEAILADTYWRHHVGQLQPMDVIRAVAEDGTWEMWLTVIKPELASVIVSKLFVVSHEAVGEVSADDDYYVKWISPPMKFGVFRKSTGDRVSPNPLYPKAAAETFMLQLKQRAA